MRRFRDNLGASFPFIPDPEGELIELYDVKLPIFTLGSRTTFVVDRQRRIVSVSTGGDAVDPTTAVEAASLACGP